ncbi:MAG: acylphosphatase [Gammaproteobacteria bacterium]|nr:acylphosphatase [Gammaproteobacteria bacterium]
MIEDPDYTCMQCVVTGKVQGVFFRVSARDQAQHLGITGYAKNLEDGNVEVVACGKVAALEQFKDWLCAGPERASVANVSCIPVKMKNHPDFRIL